MWWSGLAAQITQKVENYMYCWEHRRAQNKEPLLSTLLPDRPWKFLEIVTTTNAQVISKLKATFGMEYQKRLSMITGRSSAVILSETLPMTHNP